MSTHLPVPSPRQLAWHDTPFYGFIHFGPNTFTGREWGYGDEDPAVFNPTRLDCRQWARAAREAGMAYLVLTAKHHDGFCLWPSPWTEHSVRRSPWRGGRGDVVREFVEACDAEGIGAGLYLSPWDRNRADYGTPAYCDYYLKQFRELVTQYGPLAEIWLDCANGGDGWYGGASERRTIDQEHYYPWAEIVALRDKYQPNALVFNNYGGADLRWIGNESGTTSGVCWAGFHDHWTVEDPEGIALLQSGLSDGAKWKPAEVDVSIRTEGHWFHHPDDAPLPLERLLRIWKDSVGRGLGLILNLPPTREGLLDEADIARLLELRDATRPFLAPPMAEGVPDATGAIWTLRLPEGVSCRAAWLEEAITEGQRICAFAVEHRPAPGSPWREIARGGSVGRRRLVEFDEPPLSGELRVRVLDSIAPPRLAAFRV